MESEMKRKNNRSGFTLIEMIVSVAVLAVAGLAVAGLFVMAHVHNQKAVDLDQSVSHCSAMVEQIKVSEATGADAEKDSLEDELWEKLLRNGSVSVFYDKKWEVLQGVALTESPNLMEYRITAQLHEMPDQEGLYVLDVTSVKINPYAMSNKGEVEVYRLSAVMEAYSREVTP